MRRFLRSTHEDLAVTEVLLGRLRPVQVTLLPLRDPSVVWVPLWGIGDFVL